MFTPLLASTARIAMSHDAGHAAFVATGTQATLVLAAVAAVALITIGLRTIRARRTLSRLSGHDR